MILYHLPVSLYSFKVRLALALKGVAVELRAPPGGSYRSDEYRALAPAGTIPVLIDGDQVLAESDAIVEYVEDLELGAPLLAGSPRERARIRMLSRWHDFHLEPAVRRLFAQTPRSARNNAAVAAADSLIADKLAVVETGLAELGPFAAGAAPTLADCGYAATLVWLDALTPEFPLAARPGPRLRRIRAALAAHPVTGPAIGDYRPLVEGWVASRVG